MAGAARSFSVRAMESLPLFIRELSEPQVPFALFAKATETPKRRVVDAHPAMHALKKWGRIGGQYDQMAAVGRL